MICCAAFLSEKNDHRDYSQVPGTGYSALGLFEHVLYLHLGAVICGHEGYDFSQVGGNNDHQRLPHKYRDTGAYTPNMYSLKGGFLLPHLRSGAVRSNNVPEKKRWACCSACATGTSCLRVIIEFEAGWGTWERLPRTCFAYTPCWP